MGKSEEITIVEPTNDTAIGTTIEIPRNRRYVSRLVPTNPKTVNFLFFLLAFLQSLMNGYTTSVTNGLNILLS